MALSLLIAAGPTHEPIDDVRYIANRSSGALGIAIARAAWDKGHTVTLLLGPVPLEAPPGIRVVPFSTSAELQTLLSQWFPRCDVLVMAAAVADHRPVRRRPGKMERGSKSVSLELEPTPDLVAECCAGRRADQRVIGFALEEPHRLEARAIEKLRRKGLDAIVANPLETMGAGDIAATVYTRAGERFAPTGAAGSNRAPPGGASAGPIKKDEFARWLVEWIERWRAETGRE